MHTSADSWLNSAATTLRRLLPMMAALCLLPLTALAKQHAALGRGLDQLVQMRKDQSPQLAKVLTQHITSVEGEVLVEVRLDPGTSADQALAELTTAGFRLEAVSDLDPSLMEGFLSLDSVEVASVAEGVRSLHAELQPRRNAGSVQSQAVALEKADLVHARGVDGSGIRVGIISDSIGRLTSFPTIADDIHSGDLPADIAVLQEGPTSGRDEGRAMAQLVHDIAPGAKIAFATGAGGIVNFSNNILRLRREYHADVIVDDLIYVDEPIYSDGLLAQTVDQVVKEGAAYFSSAGNCSMDAFEDEYRPIPFSEAQKWVAEGKENLDLSALVAAAGGHAPQTLHLFRDKGGATSLSQKFTIEFDPARITFQWDEPFFRHKVATQMDVFVFDENGHFLFPYKSRSPVYYTASNNIATDEPFEFLSIAPPPGQASGRYQFIVANWNNGPAQRFKYVNINFGSFQREDLSAPSIFGHCAARGAQAVAAMFYRITDFPEDFSSQGPVTIYLDTDGNRLPKPEIRSVPQITGIDGVNITFLDYSSSDIEGDGRANFFGTSAAAPNVAAVAALVLQAEGGPGSMKPEDLYARLQRTATPVPVSLDRTLAGAVAGPVVVTAEGDQTFFDQYFSISVLPVTNRTIRSVTLDLTDTGLNFWPDMSLFQRGTTVGLESSDLTPSVSEDLRKLTLSFKPGVFGGNDLVTFGAFANNPKMVWFTGLDADRFVGTKVTVVYDDGKTSAGTFIPKPKMRINTFTGAGLVNADAAITRRQ